MLIPALSSPLRDAASQSDSAISCFPSIVSKFNNRAHRTGAYDSPIAAAYIRNENGPPIDPCAHSSGAERFAHVVDVTPNGSFLLIFVIGLSECFQIKTRLALAPQVDRVAFVKVEPPGRCLRFPAHAVVVLGEFCRSSVWIIGCGTRVAINHSHDASLLCLQRNLESQFVRLSVTIKIIGLRRKFECL